MREDIEKYWHFIVIVFSVIIAVKLRLLNPWNSVFTFTVRLGGNDPWYYYRLIENCIHNFPYRIWFDPFTHYPYGSYTHFGPFLVYLGAILSMLAGATSGEAVRNVLVYIPVLGGVLVIFPTYLLTKEVFGKRAGAIAAFVISFIPGQFLQRSMLGFNDHHVWEVFWMTATLSLYTFSVNRWMKSEEWKIRQNLIYAILSGIAFGMYLDTWPPGFIVGLIIAISIYIAVLLDFDIKNVLPLTAVFYAVAALIYLPFAFNAPGFSTTRYTPFHLIVLGFLTLLVLLIWFVYDRYDRIQSVIKVSRRSAFLGVGLIPLVVLPLIAPDFFAKLAGIVHVVQPKGGALTVAEVYPFFFTRTGAFTLSNAVIHFGSTFFFAIPGMIYAALLLYKERRYVLLLALVWGFAMLVALAGQNRFAYYFAVVSALYSALILHKMFEKLHLYNAIESVLGSRAKFSYFRIFVALLIAIALFYPTYALAEWESGNTGGPNKQWYDALMWLRENTPGKEKYDEYYYQLYPYPSNSSQPYPYPFQTYGIMSWWDYGHWIEAIGHRMPIANPFQHGIGNKYNNVPGASSFFTSFSEDEAEKIAEELNVRYVISDLEMATGKFYAMAVWAEGSLEGAEKYYYGLTYITKNGVIGFAPTKWDVPPQSVILPMTNPSVYYYESMEARLHIFDGVGLHHYRMVYESKPDNLWNRVMEEAKSKGVEKLNDSTVFRVAMRVAYQDALYGYPMPIFSQEVLTKYVYKSIYQKKLGIPLETISPSGYVKIFERVRGAVITGKVGSDVRKVKLRVKIETNQNRTFDYVLESNVTNGSYSFVVPYAQKTSYPVKPVTPYQIVAGNVTKEVTLSDEDVLNGKVVRVDFV